MITMELLKGEGKGKKYVCWGVGWGGGEIVLHIYICVCMYVYINLVWNRGEEYAGGKSP